MCTQALSCSLEKAKHLKTYTILSTSSKGGPKHHYKSNKTLCLYLKALTLCILVLQVLEKRDNQATVHNEERQRFSSTFVTNFDD